MKSAPVMLQLSRIPRLEPSDATELLVEPVSSFTTVVTDAVN